MTKQAENCASSIQNTLSVQHADLFIGVISEWPVRRSPRFSTIEISVKRELARR